MPFQVENDNKMIKDLGKLHMHRFQLTDDLGNVVLEPWEGKVAYGWEWMRNESVFTGYTREEKCSFFKIERNAPVYISDILIQGKNTDLAWFTSEAQIGGKYNVAARLIDGVEKFEPGQPVTLVILGCCSIMKAKVEPEKT